jgi:hypothetical protein
LASIIAAVPAYAASCVMPSLFRLLFVLGVLGGLAYGAVFSLATMVDPKPREITVTIPQDHLFKNR